MIAFTPYFASKPFSQKDFNGRRMCNGKNFGEIAIILLVFAVADRAFSREKIREFSKKFYDPFGDRKTKQDSFWGNPLDVMTFHRDKMNEYLCRSYVANEIVERFRNSSNYKRDGKHRGILRMARESMLEDPGSKKYKNWLSRSSTLEDMYNHFEHGEPPGPLVHEEAEQEYESEQDGEVTGYALLDSKHIYQKPIQYETDNHHGGSDIDAYYHYHEEEEEKDEEKGLKLKELFHFALTSIAFLAFATFMIEVFMCLNEIPAAKNPDYLLVPTGTGPEYKTVNDSSEAKRQARSAHSNSVSMETLNIMSSKVLSSIEGLALLHEDDGECFQRALCQSSKYSKTLSGSQKMWLPIWSFGIGWIGSRLTQKTNPSGDANALKYLKAAVMGLGSQECHVLHPKCDDRRRRRKKKTRH